MAKADLNPRIIQQQMKLKNEDADELRKRGYALGRTLGEGSYAKVKVARSDKHGKNVAIKMISLKNAPRNFRKKFLPRELEVLRILDHPRIIKLLDVLFTQNKVYVITELAGHGDLLEYVRLFGSLTEVRAKPLFRQIVDAVSYCHSRDIIHRDLKCENILLDAENNIRVSDFGFARVLLKTDQSHTYCGSAAYTAPEILIGKPYSGRPADIWSMGVILYIMVTGHMPFNDNNLRQLLVAQEKKVYFKSKATSDDCKQLIRSMIEFKIRKRATIDSIKCSDWLKTEPTKAPIPTTNISFPFEKKQIPLTTNPCPALQVDSKDNGNLEDANNSGIGIRVQVNSGIRFECKFS